MAGKDESFSMKPCGTGSMEAEGAVTGEEGALICRAGKEDYSLNSCSREGGSKSLEGFFLLKPCTNGSMAAAKAFSGKEFLLKRCASKSMVGITGKQESSLKLCPDEGMNMKGVTGKEQCSLKEVTGEEECSLKICPTKRKAPTAGHLHHLKAGASKRKGDDYCLEGDIAVTDAVFSEEVDKCVGATVLADVTMDEIEDQAIGETKVAASMGKGTPGTGSSEVGKFADAEVESDKTINEEQDEKPFTETKVTVPENVVLDREVDKCAGATVVTGGTRSLQFRDDSSDDSEVEEEVDGEEGDDNKEEDESDGNEIISDAEFRLILEENNEIVKKYVQEKMFAGLDWGLADSMDIFYGSEDEGEEDEEGEVVLDDPRVEAI